MDNRFKKNEEKSNEPEIDPLTRMSPAKEIKDAEKQSHCSQIG